MASLPKATAFGEMVREYQMMGVHPVGHVMAYVRERLGKHVLISNEVPHVPDGEEVTVAGGWSSDVSARWQVRCSSRWRTSSATSQ